jgi:flagellar basal body-associated protein FliL
MNTMKNLMKNKLALIGIGAVIVVIVVAVGLYLMNSKKAKEGTGPVVTSEEEAVQMKPEDIGLENKRIQD